MQSNGPMLRITKCGSTYKFNFNSALVKSAGLHVGDRVNLMVSENQFAFVPNPNGDLTIRTQGPSAKGLSLSNKQAYLEILARLKNKNVKEFMAEVEMGVIKCYF